MPEEFIEDIIAASTSNVDQTPNETTESNPVESSSEINITNETLSETDQTPQPDSQNNETETVEQTNETDESEQSQSVESLATQLGWNADHSGPNSVDAATYILRSREIQDSMKERNDSLKSQLTNLQFSIDALKEHNERVYQSDLAAKQAEIETLKKEKRAAVELADADKVDEIDSKIDNIKKNLNQPAPQSKPSVNPAFDSWVKDNQWYLTDNDMAQYADTVAQQYVGAPPERIFSIVRSKVAEIWPEKFEEQKPVQQNKTTLANVAEQNQQPKPPKPVGPASPVEAAKPSGQKPIFSKADLSQDQLAIMRQFSQAGIMTEEQYIKDIAKLQG